MLSFGTLLLSAYLSCRCSRVILCQLNQSLAALNFRFSPWPGELIYRKIPNNGWGVYLFQSLNRPGGNSGQRLNSFLSKIRDENVTNFASFLVNFLASFWAIVVRLLQVKLLQWRKRFSQPALTTNSSSLLSLMHLYGHRPDHFTGHCRGVPVSACSSQAPH